MAQTVGVVVSGMRTWSVGREAASCYTASNPSGIGIGSEDDPTDPGGQRGGGIGRATLSPEHDEMSTMR